MPSPANTLLQSSDISFFTASQPGQLHAADTAAFWVVRVTASTIRTDGGHLSLFEADGGVSGPCSGGGEQTGFSEWKRRTFG